MVTFYSPVTNCPIIEILEFRMKRFFYFFVDFMGWHAHVISVR